MNLGYPHEIKIMELANVIKHKIGSNSEIIFKENNENEPFRRIPSIELAKELLDWKPEIPLDLGLGNTINYFKNLINPS